MILIVSCAPQITTFYSQYHIVLYGRVKNLITEHTQFLNVLICTSHYRQYVKMMMISTLDYNNNASYTQTVVVDVNLYLRRVESPDSSTRGIVAHAGICVPDKIVAHTEMYA